MKLSISLLFVALISTSIVLSQEKKDVLLTIDDSPIYASEFKRVYKKNLELVKDEAQKSVEGYLDLFIDYKLKVAEAYNQELHKKKSYIREFRDYQEQLSRYYIYEDNVTSDLVKEAYERDLYEINASHILISSSFADSPADTLKAYNKIKDIQKQAKAGEDFAALAKQYSTDPSAAENGGNLGYFSTFAMVYPFETAAYTTKVGEVSDVVRTQFGYHIVKVLDKREKEPKRTVSHIMIIDKADSTRTFNPQERINEIYQLYKQGETFDELAKKFSEDKGSATNGGTLRPFSKSEIRYELFANAIFSMNEIGQVTKPFKSELGWHIVRLDKIHDNPSFEEVKPELERRVKDGARSKIVTAAVTNQIKEKYGFKKGEAYAPFFTTYVNDSLLRRKWVKKEIAAKENKLLFTIGDRNVTFDDFTSYIDENQGKVRGVKSIEEALLKLYDDFEINEVKQYYKDKLEQEDPEYAAVINEYRDGLLIFDIMNKNVWQKAKLDTVGLQQYYENNKQNFTWKKRIDGAIFSMTTNEAANQVKQLLENGKTIEEIKKTLNSEDKVNVIVSAGKFEIDNTKLPKGFQAKVGVSEIYGANNDFTLVQVQTIIPPSTKEFDEVKGRVMSDYQAQVEKDWIQSLHDSYKVEVHKKTLKKLKKELDS